MQKIDDALQSALSDASLESVIAQYYNTAISATMLPSIRHEAPLPATVYKDVAEQLVGELHAAGVLGTADPANSVINVMLPKEVVLSSEPSTQTPSSSGEPSQPEGANEEEAHQQAPKVNPEAGDAVESTEGLGGYHGSIEAKDSLIVYYAVGVYSEGHNGIAAFNEPWKNVVATFYHELNEARTDPDVERVNAGHENLLGWYSQTGGGEIGDLPINACEGKLELVFVEVPLADGTRSVPIQIMWSNAANGPATKKH